MTTTAAQIAITNRTRQAAIPEIHSAFFGTPDGSTPPASYDSGQALAFVGYPPVFEDGRWSSDGSPNPRSTYLNTPDLGAPVTQLGGRFLVREPLAGPATGSGLACIAVANEPLTNGGTPATVDLPLHVWVTQTHWAITIYHGSDHGGPVQQILTESYFPVPLEVGREYELEAWINGDTITVLLPDGTLRTGSHPDVVNYAGNFAFFQSAMGSGDTDARFAFSHVWADTRESTPGPGGVTRSQGSQIADDFWAFTKPVNFVNGFQYSDGSGAGKIMVSDEYGIGRWTDPSPTAPPASTAKISRHTIMALGDSLSAVCSKYDAATGRDSHAGGSSGGHSSNDWLMLGNLLAGSPLESLGACATAGMTIQQIKNAHLPTVLTAAPTFCVVYVGGNNALAAGDSIGAADLALAQSICDDLEAVGTTPILATLPPAASIQPAELDRINTWAANLAQVRGYPLLDFYAALVNPSTGGYKAGYSTASGDSPAHTHPTPAAAPAMAGVVRDVIQKIAGIPTRAYFAAWNGLAGPSLAANPLLSASSGSLPTGWSGAGATLTLTGSPTAPGNRWSIKRGSSDAYYQGPQIGCAAGDEWDLSIRFGAVVPAGGTWTLVLVDEDGAYPAIAWSQTTPVPVGTALHWRGVVPAGSTKLAVALVVGGVANTEVILEQVTLRNLTTQGSAEQAS